LVAPYPIRWTVNDVPGNVNWPPSEALLIVGLLSSLRQNNYTTEMVQTPDCAQTIAVVKY